MVSGADCQSTKSHGILILIIYNKIMDKVIVSARGPLRSEASGQVSRKAYFTGFSLILSFILGLALGKYDFNISKNGAVAVSGPNSALEENIVQNKDVDTLLFWQAWQTVRDNYVTQPVDEKVLQEGAIRGLVDSMDDPHSVYLTAKENQEFQQELSGSFFGIGAEVAIRNYQLQVVAPLAGTPAEKAGLRAGDFILKINNEDTSEMSLDFAVSKIRGPKGTEVVLNIFRAGEKEARDVKIVRDEIKIESVKWENKNGYAYIKLSYFNQDTGAIFDRLAKEIARANVKGIILDLRNDPGGFLDVAVDIAGNFIDNKLVVSEKFSDGSTQEHKTSGVARLAGLPIVTLINEGSASASEILAGALKDYGLSKIIGKKSYGKGSVQTLFDLKDGSTIKLTIAHWLTPNGNTIEKMGITPDVEVDLTQDDFEANKDPQLAKALEILNSK